MDLNIVLSSDDNYAHHLGICIVSILENNSEYFDKIYIHVLNHDISINNIQLLTSLKKKYNKLEYHFYDISLIKDLVPEPSEDNIYSNLGTSTYISAYSRLFLNRFLDEDIDKVLYLDSDIIVDGSLYELYNIDIGDNYCSGVISHYTFLENIRLKSFTDFDVFFFSGMHVINLKKWRLDKVDKKFLKFIYTFPHNLNKYLSDILCINEIFKQKILPVHLKYNSVSDIFYIKYNNLIKWNTKSFFYYSNNEFDEAINDPIVIHFVGGAWGRPWETDCDHPFKERYIYYKNISPWKGIPLKDLPLYKKVYRFLLKKAVIHLPWKISSYLFFLKNLLKI